MAFFQVPEGCCGWIKVDGAWQETDENSLDVSLLNFLPQWHSGSVACGV